MSVRFEEIATACGRRFGDFAEGIFALMTDKDRNPRWKPATLAEVTPIHIQSFIQPPHPLADLARGVRSTTQHPERQAP